MYVEYLGAILTYMKALNEASDGIDEVDGMTPHINHIPVILEDTLCGFLVDEIGGVYSYREATTKDDEWWDERPWRLPVV